MADITAVIFDVYETLVHNGRALWVHTFDEICEEQVLPLKGQELWDRWWPHVLKFRSSRTNLQALEESPPFKTYEEAWRDGFQQVFQEVGRGDAAAAAKRSVEELGSRESFPEALDVVAHLRDTGRFRLGVLSNADIDSLEPLLESLGAAFDVVLSSESARMYKPDPRIFRRILDQLGVDTATSLYVGDSQFDDVQGARRVGMQTAWVNRNGASLDPSLPGPDYTVTNLLELLDILEVPSL